MYLRYGRFARARTKGRLVRARKWAGMISRHDDGNDDM